MQTAKSLVDFLRRSAEVTAWVGEHHFLHKLGKGAYDFAYQSEDTHDDYGTVAAILDGARDGDPEYIKLAMVLAFPPMQIRWLWSMRWYASGMPRIVWDNSNYAEMLMASSAHSSTIKVCRPPWPAFLIDLPRSLLYSTIDDRHVELRQVLVHHATYNGETRWVIMAEGPSGNSLNSLELWRHGLSTEQLVNVTRAEMYLDDGDVFEKADEQDRRTLMLVGRLIVGVCLALSDPANIRLAKHSKTSSSGKNRVSKQPITRNFVVGKPIKLKVRQALQDFVKEGIKTGSSPTVQVLVRGHWKMQPYGPRNSMRKLIFREPYWRGGERDAIKIPVVGL